MTVSGTPQPPKTILFQTDEAEKFLELLTSHPFYEPQLGEERDEKNIAWLRTHPRVSFLPSKMSSLWAYHEKNLESPFPIGDGKVAGRLAHLKKKSGFGWQIYYFVNPVMRTGERKLGSTKVDHGFATDDDIYRVLWRVEDFDFRLPCSITELYAEFGLKPGIIVCTSNYGFDRYQVLTPIGIDEVWDGTGRNDETVHWMKEVQSALCSDPIADPKRLLRLPGFPNWKRWEEDSIRKAALQGPTIAKLVHYETDLSGVSWGMEETLERARKFRDSPEGVELLKARNAHLGERKKSSVGVKEKLNGSSPHGVEGAEVVESEVRVSDGFVRWTIALENTKFGIVSVGEGGRHNALCAWAGQMANAGLNEDEIKEKLRLLADKACSPSFLEEAGDLYGIMRYARKWVEEETAASASEIESVLGEAVQVVEAVDVGADVLPEHKIDYGKMMESAQGDRRKSLEKSTRDVAIPWGAAGETTEDYLAWLASVVLGVFEAQSYGGNSLKLVEAFIARFGEKNLITRGGYALRIVGRTRWKDPFLRMEALFEVGETKAFLRRVIEHVSERCAKMQKKLRGHPVLKDAQAEIDARNAGKEDAEKVDLPYVWAAKGAFLNGLVEQLVDERTFHSAQVFPEGVAILQNGSFEPGGKGFEADSELRVLTPNAVLTKWDEEVAGRMREAMSDEEGESGGAWRKWGIGGEESPTGVFDAFLARSFPDDERDREAVYLLIGYSMLVGNPFQLLFFFQGRTSSGKSTLANIIGELVGSHNVGVQDFEMLCDETGLAPARGKLVFLIEEAETSNRALYRRVSPVFKKIASGSLVRVRDKYERQEGTRIGAKCITISNASIELDDVGGAISRRAVTFLFQHSVRADEVEEALRGDVVGNVVAEADAIVMRGLLVLEKYWAAGREMFRRTGSVAVKLGEEKMESDMNPIRMFLMSIMRKYEGYRGKDESSFGGHQAKDEVPWTKVRPAMLCALVVVAKRSGVEMAWSGPLLKNIKMEMERLGFEFSRRRAPAAIEGDAVNMVQSWEGAEIDVVKLENDIGVSFADVIQEMRKQNEALKQGGIEPITRKMILEFYEPQLKEIGSSVAHLLGEVEDESFWGEGGFKM